MVEVKSKHSLNKAKLGLVVGACSDSRANQLPGSTSDRSAYKPQNKSTGAQDKLVAIVYGVNVTFLQPDIT